MGQPITVVEKRSTANPAVLRFETNRPLSGMGHERYTEPPGDLLQRPVDELARRLFAAGGVDSVHINGSVVTVTLGGGRTGEGLADIVRGLFLHYTDDGQATVHPPPTRPIGPPRPPPIRATRRRPRPRREPHPATPDPRPADARRAMMGAGWT